MKKINILFKCTKFFENLGKNALAAVIALFFISSSSFGQGVSFSQWANVPGNTPTGQWIPGILNPNNSLYYEGTATLQRLVLVNLPTATNNQYELKFKVLAKKGNVYAYDFVTSFDQAFVDYTKIVGNNTMLYDGYTNKVDLVRGGTYPNPATQAMIQQLYPNGVNISAQAAASDYNPVVPLPSPLTGDPLVKATVDFYDDAAVGKYNGDRKIQIYGMPGLLLTDPEVKFNGFEKGGSDTYGLYTVRFKSDAGNNILILMAGHLAIGEIPKSNPTFGGLSYDTKNGASSIKGGPYHFKLESVNGSTTGAQDNQIQAGAIQPPPIILCDITGITGTVCSGSKNGHTASVTSNGQLVAGATYTWEIKSGDATIENPDQGFTNKKTVTVGSSVTSSSINVFAGTGDYTLRVTITKTGSTLNTFCETTVDVAASPDQPKVIINDGINSLCSPPTLPSVKVCNPIDGATYVIEYGEKVNNEFPNSVSLTNTATDNQDNYPDVIFTDLDPGFGFRIKVTVGDCPSAWTDCTSNSTDPEIEDFIITQEECDLLSGRHAAPGTGTKPTSAINKSDAKDLIAYPVPFSEKVTVEFKAKKAENYVINLYDLEGRLVKELKAGKAKAGEVIKVDVSGTGMRESMYLVRKVSKSGVSTVKLLKKD